ncbi:hypothetical protein [Paenibacillus sp. MBLB4367]|uniref:hypothetical protein n=1 Tax=Paenibacillus sp. MBLB4367 TaxID=3384767 RepID=UPI0039082032
MLPFYILYNQEEQSYQPEPVGDSAVTNCPQSQYNIAYWGGMMMDIYERYHTCNRYMNRRVSVITVDGRRHEGVIVGVDEQNVYLDMSESPDYRAETLSTKRKKAKTSGFGYGYGYGNGFGFGGAILPLVLFSLLAIALI